MDKIYYVPHSGTKNHKLGDESEDLSDMMIK